MKKYGYYLFLFLLIIQACKSDDVVEEMAISTALDGKYYLESMFTTTKSVDLNRDGQSSLDLSTEIKELENVNTYFLELSTVDQSDNLPLLQTINQRVPFANVFLDDQGNFEEVQYGFKGLLSKYSFNENTNEIEIIPIVSEEIVSAELLESGRIKVVSQVTFYTTEGWELLELESIYRKES